jgi:nitroreductase
MELFQAITDRRSVRKFLDKPVEEEKVLKILDAARWAPSAGNLQDWQFVVVRNKAIKLLLAEAAFGQYWIASAPVIIIVCSKPYRLSKIYGKLGESIYSLMDCSFATQNMLLAVHSLGLGATMVPALDLDAVRRILNIPADIKVYAMIPIGYPAEKPNVPHRHGLETMTFFDSYGTTWAKEVPGSIRPVFIRRDQPYIEY